MNVRTDGLAAVLGPLAADPRIRVAALVDVDSGMVLDSCGPDSGPDTASDVEVRGAGHAELVRTALVVAPGPGTCEIVVRAPDGSHHLLHPVPDPHGDRLALAVVVHGSAWLVTRVRRRLRAVSAAALTAGPSTALRPGADGWRPDRLRERPVPVPPPRRPRPLVTTSDTAAPAVDPEATGPRLPAMARLPPAGAAPYGVAGSTWTAPPAPSSPLTATAPQARAPGTGPAADVPSEPPGRPAPPSALPPAPRDGTRPGATLDRPGDIRT